MNYLNANLIIVINLKVKLFIVFKKCYYKLRLSQVSWVKFIRAFAIESAPVTYIPLPLSLIKCDDKRDLG